MALFNKINLKATTTISLNERFTALRNQQQQQQLKPRGGTDVITSSGTSNLLNNTRDQFQSSLRNRRLAMQMASRPSVMAALKLKKKSLKQRLGGPNVKMRLGGAPRGNWRGRGRRGRISQRGSWNQRLPLRSGTSPLLKNRLGTATQNFNRSTSQSNRSSSQFGRKGSRGRISNQSRFRGRGRGFRTQNSNARSRPNRGGSLRGGQRRGGGISRGGRRRWGEPVPSKEELDNELDQYMAKIKTEPSPSFLFS